MRNEKNRLIFFIEILCGSSGLTHLTGNIFRYTFKRIHLGNDLADIESIEARTRLLGHSDNEDGHAALICLVQYVTITVNHDLSEDIPYENVSL